MKKIIKSHPLMLFDFLKPVLWLAFLPGLRNIIYFVFLKKNGGFRLFEVVFFIFLSIFAEMERRSFCIEFCKDSFTVKKGVVFKSREKFYKNTIVSIYMRQNLIERLFGAVTVYFNTAASKSGLKITVCQKDVIKAKEFMEMGRILAKKRFPVLKTVFWAAASSSAIEGILIFIPAIRRAQKFFGLEFFNTFLVQITDKPLFNDKYLPQAVNILSLVLLAVYLWGFIYELLKNFGLNVCLYEKNVEVEKGIITKRHIYLQRSELMGFCAEQTLIMRILRRYALKGIIGGYSGGAFSGNLIAPFKTRRELKENISRLFFVAYSSDKTVKKAKARFGAVSVLWSPFVLLTAAVFVTFVVVLVFKGIKRIAVFGLILCLLLIVVYSSFLLYGYYKSGILFGKSLIISGTKGFKVRKLYLTPHSLGMIKLRQNPFARRRGSCRAVIYPYPINVQSAVVNWVDRKDIIENLVNIE